MAIPKPMFAGGSRFDGAAPSPRRRRRIVVESMIQGCGERVLALQFKLGHYH